MQLLENKRSNSSMIGYKGDVFTLKALDERFTSFEARQK